jgi:hypothetical protein
MHAGEYIGAFAATRSDARLPGPPSGRPVRPTMIGGAMADVLSPDSSGGTAPGDPGYLRHVCHQLRQPLVVAVGYISIIEDGAFGDLPAEASSVIRIVAERLDAMNAIIDDLAAADAPSREA